MADTAPHVVLEIAHTQAQVATPKHTNPGLKAGRQEYPSENLSIVQGSGTGSRSSTTCSIHLVWSAETYFHSTPRVGLTTNHNCKQGPTCTTDSILRDLFMSDTRINCDRLLAGALEGTCCSRPLGYLRTGTFAAPGSRAPCHAGLSLT